MQSRKPNKTLVVILSSTRGHHITWNNFRINVLNHLQADLALAVEESTNDTKSRNSFHMNAKYVWELSRPIKNDYMTYYDEVAQHCFNHSFDEAYAHIIGQVNRKSSGWLGCIHAAWQPACSGMIIFFRYFALQSIIIHKLYEIYTQVIITRSDFLWIRPHENIIANMNPGHIYVPEA